MATKGNGTAAAAKVAAVAHPMAEEPMEIAENINYHAQYSPHFSAFKFEPEQAYYATAESVRDRLIKQWNETYLHYHKVDPKQTYYLSMEYLQGRALTNAIGNLTIQDPYADALNKLGHELEEIIEQEKDAALGNGGLGRLASCFLDSMATLNLPAWGYGLRYRYGLFKQRISKEGQEESASGEEYVNVVQLKPWLDPRALATALRNWSPDEVLALEGAQFIWTTRLVCKILRYFKSPKQAWDFFCWVACQPGFTHDIYTIQRMIALLARHGRVQLVDELINRIRRERIRMPFSTIRLIIDLYGVSKKADAALKVFRDDRDLCGPISRFNLMLLYSSLLHALTKCRRNFDVMDVLEEMILCDIFPDIQTFSGLIHHFGLERDIKKVQEVHAMVKQGGVEPDAHVFNVLIQAYCNCQRASLGRRVFEDMVNSKLKPDAATKELLVKSLWKEGKRIEAAAVEKSYQEINDALPLMLHGHLWTVSSSDLTKIHNIYRNSFTSTSG